MKKHIIQELFEQVNVITFPNAIVDYGSNSNCLVAALSEEDVNENFSLQNFFQNSEDLNSIKFKAVKRKDLVKNNINDDTVYLVFPDISFYYSQN